MKKASYNRTISSIAPLEKTLREKQMRVRLVNTFMIVIVSATFDLIQCHVGQKLASCTW